MSTAMRETLAVATPYWGFELEATGPESWILRITNQGTLSSTFVPVRVGISGDSSASVGHFSFTTDGKAHLQPGDTLDYRITASIQQRAKRSWEKDRFRLEIGHIAIYGIGTDDISLMLPEWRQPDTGAETLEFDGSGDLIEK